MRKEIIENLEDEIWIEDSGYEISNKGRIIGKHGKLLKFQENKYGYLQTHVKFDDGFIARSVHRAIAHVFIPNTNNYEDVNHKDGNKLNNCVENLEWTTHKENMQHRSDVLGCMVGTDNPLNILNEAQVLEIYALCKEGNHTYKEIAEIYNVYKDTISRIATGRNWKYLNLEPIKVIRGSRRNKYISSKINKIIQTN